MPQLTKAATMKQLLLLSGKGGTGKTSVTAAFAHLAASGELAGQVALADADVDAANLDLALRPQRLSAQDFSGGKVAEIDLEHCTACGVCESVCRFDAIAQVNGTYRVDPVACDGCAACVYQCPERAIAMYPQVASQIYVSLSRYGPLHHAQLLPGQENSGKLVTLVKQRARQQALQEGKRLLLVDGPPGIGCPVIAAISGADLALVVTEPTVSGLHDLGRALELLGHFKTTPLVAINKADLSPAGSAQIEAFCRERGVEVVGQIPFDLTATQALVAGEALTAFQPESPAGVALRRLWERVSAHFTQEVPQAISRSRVSISFSGEST